MKIEIWSDFVCPFCYIGKRQLDKSLEQFPHKDEVTIEFKSFQLDPYTTPYNGEDYYEVMAEKLGSIEQVKEMTNNISKQGEQVGLTFNFSDIKQANTFNAHRLAKYAAEHNKDSEITEQLLYAHFTNTRDIGDTNTLIDIAEQVGLNRKDVQAMLQNKEDYRDDIQYDINEAEQFNVTGVPFFLINRKYALPGIQTENIITQTLKQIWKNEHE